MFEALFKYPRADYLRGELVYLADWPVWFAYAVAAVALAIFALLLYRRRRSAPGRRLAIIGALQLAMLGVVLWALREPTLAIDRLRDGENSIALVLDVSASMAYGEDESRLDVARRSLADVLAQQSSLALAVRRYELGSTPVPVETYENSVPAAPATSIADALAGVLEQARYRPLAAVVLASDGADTDGGLSTDELAALAGYGVPVHTIGVGRERIPEDLELADVTVPAKALPGSSVAARVTVRHDAAGRTNVKVYDGDEIIDIVPLTLGEGAGATTALIDIELKEPGPHQVHFAVDSGAGEPELRNNRRAAMIDVADQQYRVLYFEGEPRWEYKFLRRAVNDDSDLRLATLLRVSPNKFYRQGIDTPAQLEEGFPSSRDELFSYDALIIGSVEAASMSLQQQENIRDFVSQRGGSLLMLAGPGGLGNGGWGQSAIADVLPARLPESTENTFHRKKAAVSLTPQGAASQMLRFDADDDLNSAAWLELPEVADYQLTGSLKPAAMTLLNARTQAGEIPLLVAQTFGRGHAYILATGGTWRWQMSMPLEDTKHETFWRQVLRAMVASAPDSVSLDTRSNDGGQEIALRAEFRDQDFSPIDDVTVSAVASHESGENVTVRMLPGEEPGVFTGAFEPPQSGTWYFEALASRDGQALAAARSSLLHETGAAEHFNFRKNAGLLQRLSDATGGRYFEAGNLSGLDDLLRYSTAGITETQYRAVWNAPAVFLLLLLLKAGEWLFRRRWRSI